uniref:Uncharacterized protein n=1 Tax=Utricularia reniformis TaxID=192314 RepID=A0A1Y0B0L4_9LAMI|nr:hypothetical protein AEK19_MT0692 [Utricularia reniformis]ART30940.1 hypothetical protein AEK19_MT0692 [Utricularia reniformis]
MFRDLFFPFYHSFKKVSISSPEIRGYINSLICFNSTRSDFLI